MSQTDIVCGTGSNELRLLMETQNKQPGGNMQKVIQQSYDRKMKALKDLPTKQLVIEKCQDMLVSRTLEYMNAIENVEKNHLKALQKLNDVIDKKEWVLAEKDKQFKAHKVEISNKDLQIRQLLNLQIKLRNCIKENQAKNLQNIASIREHHKKELYDMGMQQECLKDQFEEDKRQLQSTIQSTLRKVQQEKKEKELLMENIQKQTQQQIQKKLIVAKTQFQKIESTLKKQIKTKKLKIQEVTKVKDSFQNKIRQLEADIEAQKKRYLKFNKIRYGQIVIPPKQKIIIPVKTETTTKPVNKVFICESVMTDNWEPPPPPKPQTSDAQIMTDPPVKDTRLEDTITFMEKKMDKAINELKLKHQDECLKIREQSKQQINNNQNKILDRYRQLEQSVNKKLEEMVKLHEQTLKARDYRYNQLEQLYATRPSRAEDIEYIKNLTQQNINLMSLCNQVNKKLQSSYSLLNICKKQLDNYKKLIPIDITSRPETPRMINPEVIAERIKKMSKSENKSDWNPHNKQPNSPLKMQSSMPIRKYRMTRKHYDRKITEDEVLKGIIESFSIKPDRTRKRFKTSMEMTSSISL